ncbi:MAG: hypothetical protein IPJ65_20550 [Archangiaceae bacterium]|nr:hypothetical protein [Archangiaceae bacterium]
MNRALIVAAVLLLAARAGAAETTVLPRHTFLVDFGYLQSTLSSRWDDARQQRPLIDEIPRYEPGGGLQGVLGARPDVVYKFVVLQLGYGITDNLTALLYLPIVVGTTIDANFSWRPGDYQPGLGRAYSEDDFWAWAQSLGQPRPASHWEGNRGTLADMVVGLRYRLEQYSILRWLGVQVAGALAVALPTGRSPDPEELLAAGTSTWELHAYGDVEAHLDVDRGFFTDAHGVSRLNLGLDLYYAFFRPRQYTAPRGTVNPLLLNYAPYVGDTYTIDPGDWFVTTVSLDVAPYYGPVRASMVSGGDVDKALALPPMVSVTFSYSYIATAPTRWQSQSALWDYDRAKLWGPGEKHAFKAQLNLSFLRVGFPVQLYVAYRAQDLAHGRNTRAADTFSAGLRLIAKFW